MNGGREPGQIILTNGASSAGESTLARSLQQQLPDPFLHWSCDHLRASSALPMMRIRRGDLDRARMRPAVLDGFQRSLPAAQAGNNLIVDHIIEQEQWLVDLVALLAPTEYDLAVDATRPNEDTVARLIAAWPARSRPTASERLATHR
jgi:chloramphenicol 3-O-phosphotransferase